MAYTINGEPQELAAPVVNDGTTYVPLAGVVETLGGYVTWDNLTKTASIELGERKGRVMADSDTVEIDGQNKTLENTPYLEGSHLYVPLAFFQTALACQVQADGEDITVTSS